MFKKELKQIIAQEVTRRDVHDNYNVVFKTSYCSMQTLLSTRREVGYNCGLYGWNFDLYDIDGVAICTGYRNIPACPALKNVEKYEEKAKKIKQSKLSYVKKIRRINQLLKQLIEENLKEVQ